MVWHGANTSTNRLNPAKKPTFRKTLTVAVRSQGYSDYYDHVKNWIDAIRTRQPVVEDPVFGFRAAGAALLSNASYESGKPARWDPDEMKLS
jgi:hypothetical protein